MFPYSRFALVAFLLLAPATASADLPRPLDENHTRRLLIEAMQERLPDARITADTRRANTRITLPDGRILRLETSELHLILRAEQDGGRREDLMAAHINALLGVNDQGTAPAARSDTRAAGTWRSVPKASPPEPVAGAEPQPAVEPPPN